MLLESLIDYSNYNGLGTNNALVVAPSSIDGNVFYLFKRNGIEVKIEIIDDIIYADKVITKYEREYFEKLIRKRNKTIENDK